MWFSNLFFFFGNPFQKISLSKKEIISEALVYSEKFLACTEKMLENALSLKTYTTKICHPHVTLVSRKCSNFCTKRTFRPYPKNPVLPTHRVETFRIFLSLRFYVKSIFGISEVTKNCRFDIFEALNSHLDSYFAFSED